MKLTVPHDTIKALLVCAAVGDIRYYLNGVAIDAQANGDVVLVATNGHILLATPLGVDDVEDLAVGTFIVGRELLESVKPAKAGREALPLHIEITVPEPAPDPERPGVTVTGRPTVSVTGATTTTTGVCVDGAFPDWRRVMPAKADGKPAQFQPGYVAAFGKVAELLVGKNHFPVIHHNGENGSALVSNIGSALGVIMPLRCDETKHPGLPAWAKKAAA